MLLQGDIYRLLRSCGHHVLNQVRRTVFHIVTVDSGDVAVVLNLPSTLELQFAANIGHLDQATTLGLEVLIALGHILLDSHILVGQHDNQVVHHAVVQTISEGQQRTGVTNLTQFVALYDLAILINSRFVANALYLLLLLVEGELEDIRGLGLHIIRCSAAAERGGVEHQLHGIV